MHIIGVQALDVKRVFNLFYHVREGSLWVKKAKWLIPLLGLRRVLWVAKVDSRRIGKDTGITGCESAFNNDPPLGVAA